MVRLETPYLDKDPHFLEALRCSVVDMSMGSDIKTISSHTRALDTKADGIWEAHRALSHSWVSSHTYNPRMLSLHPHRPVLVQRGVAYSSSTYDTYRQAMDQHLEGYITRMSAFLEFLPPAILSHTPLQLSPWHGASLQR